MKQKHGNADGKEPTDLSSEDDRGSTGSRLIEFLDEMHATMPDVPEEEAQRDIEEAIAAIRNQSKP
ncbi:MAG: hypothetical protein F4Y84_02485 [Caldilineaceae bacterium SB0665_bin_25]|nr:hypothetical protein [Caldilineaceae bacterium SB0665_bin_25]